MLWPQRRPYLAALKGNALGWLWLSLYALGTLVALYALAALTMILLARFGRSSPDEIDGAEYPYTPSCPDTPPFADWRDRPVTEADVWMAAKFLVDQHGAAAAIHAKDNAKLAVDDRDREIWLRIRREIVGGQIKPREAGVLPGSW